MHSALLTDALLTDAIQAGNFRNGPVRKNTGKTWYLLFQFNNNASSDASDGDNGWVSFDANVEYPLSYITITGWGWDDTGNPIAAGATAETVPEPASLAIWGGIETLALGAAAIRRRRKADKEVG